VPATPKPKSIADDLPEIPDAKVLEYQKRGGTCDGRDHG
jgi:hypothetical protein